MVDRLVWWILPRPRLCTQHLPSWGGGCQTRVLLGAAAAGVAVGSRVGGAAKRLLLDPQGTGRLVRAPAAFPASGAAHFGQSPSWLLSNRLNGRAWPATQIKHGRVAGKALRFESIFPTNRNPGGACPRLRAGRRSPQSSRWRPRRLPGLACHGEQAQVQQPDDARRPHRIAPVPRGCLGVPANALALVNSAAARVMEDLRPTLLGRCAGLGVGQAGLGGLLGRRRAWRRLRPNERLARRRERAWVAMRAGPGTCAILCGCRASSDCFSRTASSEVLALKGPE